MKKNGCHARVIRCPRGVLSGAVLAIAALPAIAQAADSLPSWTDGASKARITYAPMNELLSMKADWRAVYADSPR